MGGLANRIRVIDSALGIAKTYNRPLKIIWEKSFELNCSFSRLFDIPNKIEIEETYRSPLSKRLAERWHSGLSRLHIRYPFGYDFHLLFNEAEDFRRIDQIAESRNCYIETVHRFASSGDFFAAVQPRAELMEKIKEIRSGFGTYTLGIHIRRTDNANAIKHSPTESFYNLIDNELSVHPHLRIFLATDSVAEQKAMETRYPGRVLFTLKSLDRNTEEGIRDALTDLYCLAATDRIIGSYYSSFSEIASEISGTPFEQVYRESL